MLKSKTKLSTIILLQMHTWVIISILSFFFSCSCSERSEEDQAQNEKYDFERNHGDKTLKEQFKVVIQGPVNEEITGDKLANYCDIATKLINNNFESLDTDPKSKENSLYILLQAMSAVTGAEGIIAEEDSRMGNYIQIFKLLRAKNIKLDNTLLEELKNMAVRPEAGIENLYYPLVVLGKIEPKTKVYYLDTLGSRKHITIPIILWTLFSDLLHKDLQKEMLDTLTNPNSIQAHIVNAELYDVQNNTMSPVMFAAYQAQNATNDVDAAYWCDIFELFLRDTKIEFMNMDKDKKSETRAISKLNDQPLLSFIVYNCVCNNVKQHDKWMNILDKALKSGDLKDRDKKSRKMIKDYIKNYVQKAGPATENHFVDNHELYNQDDLKKVEEKLNAYIQ